MIETESRQSRYGRLTASIKRQDKFSEGFHMKLTNGEDTVPTWMGTLCTILLFLIILAYTVQKMEVLFSKKDIDIITALNDSSLDSDFRFGSEQGFNIATKWYSHEDETEELDPSIGKL